MKTIFDEIVRNELINRIKSLEAGHTARWGKMNLYQMTKHNVIWNEWILGKKQKVYKQEFLGLIFGKMALKGTVDNERPMKKGMPAGRKFTVKEKEGEFATQKKIWMKLLAEYALYSNPAFVHDFFGKMTEAEIGILAYKHTDHHLRQFGV